jgi:hypothetical protein
MEFSVGPAKLPVRGMTEDEIQELLEELKRLRKLEQETRHCWCKHCRELRYRANRAKDAPVPQPPMIRI